MKNVSPQDDNMYGICTEYVQNMEKFIKQWQKYSNTIEKGTYYYVVLHFTDMSKILVVSPNPKPCLFFLHLIILRNRKVEPPYHSKTSNNDLHTKNMLNRTE